MKRALIIAAIILLLASTVGIICLVVVPNLKPNDPQPEETANIEDNYSFELSWNDTYVLTIDKFEPVNGVIRFPDSYEGKPISMIARSRSTYSADTSDVKEIIIPDSVTKIGELAFRGMVNLETVTLGANVETIGDSAFLV